MTQFLITQFSESWPKILVLGQEGVFSQKLQTLLQEKGFRTEFANAGQFSTDESLQEEISKKNYYKIIWLFGWQPEAEPFKKVVHWLNERLEPTLVIARLDTIPDIDDKAFSLERRQWDKQIRAINYFAQNLSKASLLIGQDIISSDFNHLGLSFLLRGHKEGKIFSPEIDFRFINLERFLHQVSNIIFAPYTNKKMVFQSDKIPYRRLEKHLLSLSQAPLEVISRPSSPAKAELIFQPEILFGSGSLDFFNEDFFYRLQEKFLITPPSFISPPAKIKTKKVFSIKEEKIILPLKQNKSLLKPLPSVVFLTVIVPNCNFLTDGVLVCRPEVKSKIIVPPLPIIGSKADTHFSPEYQKYLNGLVRQAPTRKPQRKLSPVVSPQKLFNQAKERPLIKKEQKVVYKQQKAQPVLVKKKTASKIGWQKIATPFVLALICLFIYFGFLLPKQSAYSQQPILQSFFQACLTPDCLNEQNQDLWQNLKTQAQSTNQEVMFINHFENFFTQRNILNQQMSRFYRVMMNSEPGTATAEVQLVQNSLFTTLESLDQLQTTLTQIKGSSVNSSLLPDLERLSQQLTKIKNNFLLWQKYQEVFTLLAQQEKTKLLVLLLNNQTLLSQGGELLALSEIDVQAGTFQKSQQIPLSRLAQNQAVKVEDSRFFSASTSSLLSLQRLPLQENFSALASKTQKILQVSQDLQLDLIFSFNLNSYVSLLAVLEQKEPDLLYQELSLELKEKTSLEQEKILLDKYQELAKKMKEISPQKTANLIFTFLEEIESQEILFYSDQPALKQLFDNLSLSGQVNARACPSLLGGSACFIDHFVQFRSSLNGQESSLQNINHSIELDSKQTKHERQIVLENPSQEEKIEFWQFVFPSLAQDIIVTIDGQKRTVDEQNGFKLTLPAQSKQIIKISFYINRVLPDDNFVYSFSEKKQSGERNQSFNLNIKNSLPYSPKVIAPYATIDGKQINFSSVKNQSFLGAVAF